MSVWDEFDITEAVLEILETPAPRTTDHHFGRPWMTAYQITVALEERYADAFAALGGPGGTGSGLPTSAPQRLARHLSERMKNDPAFPIEGADLSTVSIRELTFDRINAQHVHSSRTNGDLLSIFRSRR